LQDLVTDKLASKHIPIAGRITALPQLFSTDRVRAPRSALTQPATAAAHPQSKAAGAIVAAVPTQTRTYTGQMTLGGSFTDSLGQSGNWSGILHETLIVTIDANGNGIGFEYFQGSLGATVKNPDGSTKSIAPEALSFTTPDFSIQNGNFTHTESGGVGFEGLALTIKLNGSLSTTQPNGSVSLNMPFHGLYDGVQFDGSIDGSSTLTTPPLALSGTAAKQTAYAGTKMTPFQNLFLTDLNGGTVTATVLLSNATHGTLTNLGGGKYNQATGTYTITGTTAAVNQALNALQFDPNPTLGSPAFPSPTGLTLRISDSKGGSLINKTTSVLSYNPLSIKGVFAHQGVQAAKTIAPFRTVTIGDLLGGETDSVKITLSNPKGGTLRNLGGGLYNKKTGVYIFKGTAAAATNAVRGLVFDPAGAAGQTTAFTIKVVNPAGASVTNAKASVVTKITTPATSVALFGQYVAAGLHGMADHAAGISALHDLPASTHLQLAAGHG